MSLYKRGDVYHYHFGLNGKRFRGSTKATTETRAKQVLKVIIAAAQQGQLLEKRRVGRLADLWLRFQKFIDASTLDPDTKRYYKQGWVLLKATALANMRIDRISREIADGVKFGDVSSAYANQARRTLRRMLGKAAEWNLINRVPRIKLAADNQRHAVIGPEEERALLSRMTGVMKDAFLCVQDAGLRPDEAVRMRVEHINWQTLTYFNASGKTAKARRFVPVSDRLFEALFIRVADRKEGWLFPAKKGKTGHVHQNTLSHWFTQARRDAGLPDSLVLYSARHTFATDMLAETGNIAAVMSAMGHSDVRMLMRYQHPGDKQVRQAVNRRNDANATQLKEQPDQNPAKVLN